MRISLSVAVLLLILSCANGLEYCTNDYKLTSWFGNLFSGPFRAQADGENLYVIDSNRKWILNISLTQFTHSVVLQQDIFTTIQTPADLAFDNLHNLYILDTSKRHIFKLSPQGKVLLRFGSQGTGPGKFDDPVSLAINQDKLFVSDATTHDIQVFNLEGNFLSCLNVSKDFETPFDLAFDSENKLYVLDSSLKKVIKLNPDTGDVILSWGSEGDEDGKFLDPVSLAIDSLDRVLVVDQTKINVQIFSANGTFLEKFGQQGGDAGQFLVPTGITSDLENNIYVVDQVADKVDVFSENGTFLSQFASNGSENGFFLSAIDLAIDSDNFIYVIDYERKDVQKFDWEGNFAKKFSKTGSGWLKLPLSISSDTDDNVYVLDNANHTFYIFDSSGNFLKSIGNFGYAQGQFIDPVSVVVDTENNVYVADASRLDIQKWNRTNDFVREFGSYGVGDGHFLSLRSITTDQLNNVYAVDLDLNVLQKFTTYGKFIEFWLIDLQNDDDPETPISLASNYFSEIFVTESCKSAVEKFSATGKVLSEIVIPNPVGIAHSSLSKCSLLIISENAVFKYESTLKEVSDPTPPYKKCHFDIDCMPTEKCVTAVKNESKYCAQYVSCDAVINGFNVKCARDGVATVDYLLPPVVPDFPLVLYFPVSGISIPHFQRFDYFLNLILVFAPPIIHEDVPLIDLPHGAALSGNVSLIISRHFLSPKSPTEFFLLRCGRKCTGNFIDFQILFSDPSVPPCTNITISPIETDTAIHLSVWIDDSKCSQPPRVWMIIELTFGSIGLFTTIVYIWYHNNRIKLRTPSRIFGTAPSEKGMQQDSFIMEDIRREKNKKIKENLNFADLEFNENNEHNENSEHNEK